MILAIFGLALGAALGFFLPVTLPLLSAKYASVLLLAALDAILGGVRAAREGELSAAELLLGFFTNALLASLLVLVGDRIGIDLYYVALLTFGLRIFRNLARLRHLFLSSSRFARKNF